MAKDFAKTAQGVMDGVGGKGNIKSLVHCATRLRFTLIDQAKANDEAVKGTSGVVSVVKAGGLYQVVIGNDVHEVFVELEKLGAPTGGMSGADEPVDTGPLTLAKIGNSLVGTVTGVFTPILAAMMGIGIIKGCMAIVTQIYPGWAGSGDMSYTVINAISDGLMYFLPILVAYTASQKFGLDPIVGMTLGAAFVYPDIVAQYPFGPFGVHKFLGVSILVLMRYSGTVLPSIFICYIGSKFYKHFREVLPSAVKNFLAPFFTLLICGIGGFLVIGPVFGIVGLGIQSGVQQIVRLSWAGPVILGLLLGFFNQILVIFGLHWALIPIAIAEISVVNPIWGANVTTLFPAMSVAPWAQTGAVFGIALKIRNTERRSAAIAAGIGGVFGITEPIIYGFTLPKRKPFFAACITAMLVTGLMEFLGNFVSDGHGIALQMGGMGVFAFPTGLIPGFSGSVANFLLAMFAAIIAAVIACLVVAATYKPDAAESQNSGEVVIDTSKVDMARAKKVFSPCKGRVLPITQSADAAHQQEAVGKGVCFMPLGGKIYAPFNGTVEMVFGTKHAISVKSDEGVELLIHCGIDTVKLGGRGFTPAVSEGQRVNAGDLLLSYDKDIIAREGYSLETQVVVTNTGDFKAVTQAKTGDCQPGDVVMYVE